MTFGQYLRKERRKALMSQRELGKKIGLTDKSIGLIENDYRLPSYEHLTRLIRLFPELIEKVKEDSK